MEKKIICFGVRDYEIPTFQELGEKYGYQLILRSQYLNDANYADALGYANVMVRGNCVVTAENLKKLYEGGLRYYLTRTAGYNHVDLKTCRELGIQVAFVPGYSPNAIAELALTLAMSLLRHSEYTADKSAHLDFRVTDTMFSKEIRECTVGILGCGRIGYTAATLFKGLGAKVLAFDRYPNDRCKDAVTYVDLETLLRKADVISLHMNYAPGQNDDFIGAKEIAQMKDGAILINCARGELLDTKAAAAAIESGKLGGLGLDVLRGEKEIFNHSFASLAEIPDPTVQRLISLYPKVLLTPHVASATDGALRDMIEVTLKNMDEYLTVGLCRNSLIKQ
jgi:D-lactate dehydrogenase